MAKREKDCAKRSNTQFSAPAAVSPVRRCKGSVCAADVRIAANANSVGAVNARVGDAVDASAGDAASRCAEDPIARGMLGSGAGRTEDAEMRRFKAWMAKYEPVERAIYAERRKRAESSRRRAIARRKAFGDLCEMTEGLARFCRDRGITLEEGERIMNAFRPSLQAAAFVAVFQTVWLGASFLRKELTKRIDRAKHEIVRPHYYVKEKARRQALAEERRRIRMRMTLNRCPTRDEILDAWVRVKESNEALLRFGSLMEDLECYVDNSLRRTEDGVIVGRRPGIKGWLQMEIPALYLKYTTVMAYKAAAKRMRQVLDISDPLPLSMVLGDAVRRPEPASCADETERRPAHGGNGQETRGVAGTQDLGADEIQGEGARHGLRGRCSADRLCEVDEPCNAKGLYKADRLCAMDGRSDVDGLCEANRLCEADEMEVLRARAVYLEVVKPVGDGVRRYAALAARLKTLTDPEMVEECNMLESWKSKYQHQITVRTKSVWERRLALAVGERCSG